MPTGTTADLNRYLGRKRGVFAVEISAQQESDRSSRMNQSEWEKEVLHIQDRVGQEMAESARKTMAKWLSPEGPYRIGQTGASSHNLVTAKVYAKGQGNSKTQVVWHVYEGNQTNANRYIRTGIKPNENKHWAILVNGNAAANNARNKESWVSAGTPSGGVIGRIAAWAKARGIQPRAEHKKPVSMSRYYARSYNHPSEKPGNAWRDTVWAIYHGILKNGGFNSYRDRFGAPFFDYPRRYVEGGGAGSSKGTAYGIARQKMARGGDEYQNLEYITADYVTALMTKTGKIILRRPTRLLSSYLSVGG